MELVSPVVHGRIPVVGPRIASKRPHCRYKSAQWNRLEQPRGRLGAIPPLAAQGPVRAAEPARSAPAAETIRVAELTVDSPPPVSRDPASGEVGPQVSHGGPAPGLASGLRQGTAPSPLGPTTGVPLYPAPSGQ